MLQLTFNPGLTLTSFRTTRPQMDTNMAAGNQQKHLSMSFATKVQIYLLKNSKTLK